MLAVIAMTTDTRFVYDRSCTVCEHTFVYIRVCVFVYVCTYICVCIYTCVFECMSECA